MLKYRRWNNELRPFQSLKRRVANIFKKWNSLSDNSKRTSTQTIVNNVESEEEESVPTNSKRNSIHSNWLTLILMGIMFLTIEKIYKMPIFRKYQYLI